MQDQEWSFTGASVALDNTDTIYVKKPYVYLRLEGYHKKYRTGNYGDILTEYESFDHVIIGIDHRVNEDRAALSGLVMGDDLQAYIAESRAEDAKLKPIDVMTNDAIAQLAIHYEDAQNDKLFFVPWSDGEWNRWQTEYTNDNGDLLIVINRDNDEAWLADQHDLLEEFKHNGDWMAY